MAFLVRDPEAHQAVAHHRGDRQGARAQTGGPRRDRARRRRAGLRHAGQHQAGGDQGDRERARLEVHRRRRHSGAQGRGVAQVQAREQSRLQAEPDHRRHRRQAGALQRPDGDAEPRRRGHHPGALLGELSRHGAARGRHAGRGRDAHGERLQDEARGAREGDHAEDQVDHLQLAVEPDRRGLHQGGAEGDHRRAGAAPAGARHDRRHVRAPGLRRFQVLHARPRSSPRSTSARSRSTAPRRPIA